MLFHSMSTRSIHRCCSPTTPIIYILLATFLQHFVFALQSGNRDYQRYINYSQRRDQRCLKMVFIFHTCIRVFLQNTCYSRTNAIIAQNYKLNHESGNINNTTYYCLQGIFPSLSTKYSSIIKYSNLHLDMQRFCKILFDHVQHYKYM